MSAEAWDAWNSTVDASLPSAHVVRFVREHFPTPVPAGTRALDLGCGSGADTRFLLECGFDVTAIDRSPVAIANTERRAAELSGGLDARVMSLGELDVPARSYACIVCVGALDAAGRDESRSAVPRAVDALRPGGRALLVITAEGDLRIGARPELGLHGFTRREVEALVVLEYGTGVWIDSCTTTFQSDTRRQVDWLVTLIKR